MSKSPQDLRRHWADGMHADNERQGLRLLVASAAGQVFLGG